MEDLLVRSKPSEMERLLKPFAGEELASEAQSELLFPASSGWGFRELLNPSEILRDHTEWGWRPGELYDKMLEKDTDLAGLWQKREKALLQLPRYIRPADSTPLAQETAAFAYSALSLIPERAKNIKHYLGAVPRGISISELIWEQLSRGPLAGAWVPVDIIDRPQWRFAFDASTRALHVRRRGAQPFPAPPGKFIRLTNETKDKPWGPALFDKVFWFWFIKRHAAKYWAVFVERFAQPLVDATYKHRGSDTPGSVEPGYSYNEQQQQLLLRLIQDISTGKGVVHPEGTTFSFLEASRGGDSTYQGFIAWLTRGEALIILGEIDTSGMAKGPGSFAKSEISNEVRLETLAHDANLIGTFETDHLLRLLIAVNFGPDAPVPKSVFDSTDAGDRQLRMEGIERALNAGEAVPRSYALMTWQIPMPMEGEEVIVRETPSPSNPFLPAGGSLAALRGGRILLAADDQLARPVQSLESDLAAIVELMLPITLEHFSQQRERLVELWTEDAGREDLLRALVAGEQPELHAEALETAQIHAAGLALQNLQNRDGGLRSGQHSISLSVPESLGRMDPATALDYWTRVLKLPKDVFLALTDGTRRVAFTVAGLTEAAALAEVHQLVERSIDQGLDRATFVKELDALYARLGLEPTSKAHAELIYANNVRQAAHLARFRQTVENPAAQRLTPYLLWWTLDDGRVRERPGFDHAAVHGFIAAIDHPFWQTWWPPAGHNCRCGTGTINAVEARRRGLKGSEPSGPWPRSITGARAMPDPGFVGSPRLEAVSDAAVEQASQIADGASDSEDLLGALRALYEQLGLAAEVFGGP